MPERYRLYLDQILNSHRADQFKNRLVIVSENRAKWFYTA